jgi:NADH-quinone oxidoreductase E subunit
MNTENQNTETTTLNQIIINYIAQCNNREHPESYLVAVLHKIQEEYGFLSRQHLTEVAYKMQIPTSNVYGVATFYNYFKLSPQGKYSISVCLGTACFVKGADKILDEYKKNLKIEVGETTADGMFSLEATRCLGVCALAPVVKINDQIFSEVEPAQVKEIIEHIRAGKLSA